MSQSSPDGKKSRAESTAVPFIIPQKMMDQSRSLRRVIFGNKQSVYRNNESGVEQYIFKSKYENSEDTEVSRYQLRPSLKPKIPNKLHLQLPRKQKVEVKKYIGQQKELELKVTGLFAKIFKCCVSPSTVDQYQECNYCEHRYYRNQNYKGRLSQQEKKELTQPYISYKRLKEREKQPIQVFYQQITNQQILSNRYGLDNKSKINKY